MNKIFAFFIVTLLGGCSMDEQHQSYADIQKVGGIIVVGQDKNPNWLILKANVSGVKAFSNKPTHLNSALTVKKVKAKITKSAIQVYVITTVASDSYPDTEITGVNISGINKGTYLVQYLNPDNSLVNLKSVVIQ